MSTVLPKAGRDLGAVRHEFLAEPHDVGSARLLRGLFSKTGRRGETYDNAEKQTGSEH